MWLLEGGQCYRQGETEYQHDSQSLTQIACISQWYSTWTRILSHLKVLINIISPPGWVLDVLLAAVLRKTVLLRMLNDSWAGQNPLRVVVPLEEEEKLTFLVQRFRNFPSIFQIARFNIFDWLLPSLTSNTKGSLWLRDLIFHTVTFIHPVFRGSTTFLIYDVTGLGKQNCFPIFIYR